VTRRDPPHDPEAVYTLRLVFSERARGSLRAANAAWVQNTKVTVGIARELVQQYGAEAELLEPDGHMRWVIGRGGALRAKRRPGSGGKIKHPSAGPALARVHVRVTKEHKAAITVACQRAGCTITQAVEAIPDLLHTVDELERVTRELAEARARTADMESQVVAAWVDDSPDDGGWTGG
jgi:hypothetical protein